MISILSYASLIAQGISITCMSWLGASAISITIGLLCGILSCNRIGRSKWTLFIPVFTFVAKGIPAYVQILIAYFALPTLLGIPVPGFIAATIALGFCSAGYTTEIIRSGINSIDEGQWDATFVHGYSVPLALKRIILPQALKISAASLLGECEQLLKSTSLLSSIGVLELTRVGMNIISRELNPLPVYALLAACYLLFSALLKIGATYAQQKGSYGYRS